MIILKKLKWSNVFSYGPNNEINFQDRKLVQLIGKNGSGKSSIALILEEVLFNKNSKGIKKANILNRAVKSKTYSIELEFEKDGIPYRINTVRGTTQTVKLYKNDIDISSHTATGTYKLIEDILGTFDQKTFSQIIYQNNAHSLEFLKATDTARKNFLISLFNLSRYGEAGDYFKAVYKELSQKLELEKTKLYAANTWLLEYTKYDTTIKELIKEIPEVDVKAIEELKRLESEVSNISDTNLKITTNYNYIQLRDAIKFDVSITKPDIDLSALDLAVNISSNKVDKLTEIISGKAKLHKNCPTCGREMDNTHKELMVKEAEAELPIAREELKVALRNWHEAKEQYKVYETNEKNKTNWERYHLLINKSLPHSVLDIDEINSKIKVLRSKIDADAAEIKRITQYNSNAIVHNTKVELLERQKQDTTQNKLKLEENVKELEERSSNLQILIKTFSPSGLVAYKIESMIKDLETLTNNYLLEMSDGRFQLWFKISQSDKLDVIITDNGEDIDINALSSGELSRVNVSALLGIRKLLETISNSKINLLILDETIESLDPEGKDRLIEVLWNEKHLNTVLVSHGFSHPVLEKINVIKENEISRIE